MFYLWTFSADTMILNQIKIYDCFVFMYHDQALIPFKFISNFSGVNFTGNLEIIRLHQIIGQL